MGEVGGYQPRFFRLVAAKTPTTQFLAYQTRSAQDMR